MSAGFVNLDVRYVDASSGFGVAVDSVVGKVYNSRGAEIDWVIPEPVLTPPHLDYVVTDYDVKDLEKFSGRPFVEVVWQAVKAGILLPDIRKRYWIPLPVSRDYANKTFVSWDRPIEPVLFYSVYRHREGVSEEPPVSVGKTFSNFFIDDTEFVSEFEARSWNYFARAHRHLDGELQEDGSDYEEDEGRLGATCCFRTSLDFCTVEGKIVDILGRSGRIEVDRYNGARVTFRQNARDRFQTKGDAFLLPEDVYGYLNSDGFFAVPLVQDAVVEIVIAVCRFRARFVVPNAVRVGLGDLDLTVLRE